MCNDYINHAAYLYMTPKQEAARHAAFSLAHHDFEEGLNKHAYFKLNNHATGEDLVQETFIKTWQYLLRGGKIDVMKAFLYHVLNNLIVDEYRKRKTSPLDALMEKGFEPSTGSSARFYDALDGKAALLLIARLPVSYQKVMRMRYVYELSLKEMALITGQSKNAIAVQAHRGLEKLRLLYDTQ
jgi:RNA polymerase sigma-70 factor (ECF subfamily)